MTATQTRPVYADRLETPDGVLPRARIHAENGRIRVWTVNRRGRVELVRDVTGHLDLGVDELRIETTTGQEWHGYVMHTCACGSPLKTIDPHDPRWNQ